MPRIASAPDAATAERRIEPLTSGARSSKDIAARPFVELAIPHYEGELDS